MASTSVSPERRGDARAGVLVDHQPRRRRPERAQLLRMGQDGARGCRGSYYYWLGLHDGAKLTKVQRRQLADGLRKTLGASRASGD
jgi:hypothetical protein